MCNKLVNGDIIPGLAEHDPGQADQLPVSGGDGPAYWAVLHLCVQTITQLSWRGNMISGLIKTLYLEALTVAKSARVGRL